MLPSREAYNGAFIRSQWFNYQGGTPLTMGGDLSLTGYANLGKSLNHFVNRLSINRLNDGTTVGLREDLSIKNPGKKIRKKMLIDAKNLSIWKHNKHANPFSKSLVCST
jgi:hypothetical protein